ncbi:hypothetical protein Q8A67_020700 [Cirrhinus molitorella]|uniref:Uncharacterized protein n=1 Tax=Cirrhinus molitorella TaxID=172907 RepID=A0AA88TE83_9TELE|nr:hypothetical protein Q8A67_020700 [Cirrhinus molitorella]
MLKKYQGQATSRNKVIKSNMLESCASLICYKETESGKEKERGFTLMDTLFIQVILQGIELSCLGCKRLATMLHQPPRFH